MIRRCPHWTRAVLPLVAVVILGTACDSENVSESADSAEDGTSVSDASPLPEDGEQTDGPVPDGEPSKPCWERTTEAECAESAACQYLDLWYQPIVELPTGEQCTENRQESRVPAPYCRTRLTPEDEQHCLAYGHTTGPEPDRCYQYDCYPEPWVHLGVDTDYCPPVCPSDAFR